MKICAVICEYNPFHNGHAFQLQKIRELSGCDTVLCIMSGNFTQRGEAAVFHKFERARHAVLGGADVVLELPTPFAIAPAELFARGAVNILSTIPDVAVLAFGVESGTSEEFLRTASLTLTETKEFKAKLKEAMADGTSYIKARNEVLLSLYPDLNTELFSSPNNILGLEYCRALLERHSSIAPLPILRTGSGYLDATLKKEFSSASAIRGAMFYPTRKEKKLLKKNVPSFVFEDTLKAVPVPYEKVFLSALVGRKANEIALCAGCSEGLENRMKALVSSNPDYTEFLEKLTTKRYSTSRLKRILCENTLGISERTMQELAVSELYYKVLAVKKDNAVPILSALEKGKYPSLSRKSDVLALKSKAKECFELDLHANDLYDVLSGKHTNAYQTVFV